MPTRSDYVASTAPEETAPKDDLDMMIDEANKIGPLVRTWYITRWKMADSLKPLEDEEDESKSMEEIETTDDEQSSPDSVKRQKPKGRGRMSDKPGHHLGTFQCLQKSDGNQMEGNPNQRTIEIVRSGADFSLKYLLTAIMNSYQRCNVIMKC